MKTYLCVEHGEKFTIKAKDRDEADEEASGWGAMVIDEIRILKDDGNGSIEYVVVVHNPLADH